MVRMVGLTAPLDMSLVDYGMALVAHVLAEPSRLLLAVALTTQSTEIREQHIERNYVLKGRK